jgi:hypothetical protein
MKAYIVTRRLTGEVSGVFANKDAAKIEANRLSKLYPSDEFPKSHVVKTWSVIE